MRRGETQPSIRWVAAATGTLDLGKSSRNCLMPETLLQVHQQYPPLPRSQTGGPKIFESQNVLGIFSCFFFLNVWISVQNQKSCYTEPSSCKATITSGWRLASLHRWGQRSLIPHRGHQCPSGRQSPLLALVWCHLPFTDVHCLLGHLLHSGFITSRILFYLYLLISRRRRGAGSIDFSWTYYHSF